MHVPRERRYSRRGARTERGNALIEAVIIFPLLMLLVFGIIEFGLAYSDAATLRSSTRAGARIGAALSKQDTQFGAVIDAVNRADTSISNATPTKLWIYRANGATPPNGPATCGTDCVEVTALNKVFPDTAPPATVQHPNGWAWNATDEWTCPGHSNRIGVTLFAQYDFITGLFGAGKQLRETTILDLEPQGSFDCAGALPEPTS